MILLSHKKKGQKQGQVKVSEQNQEWEKVLDSNKKQETAKALEQANRHNINPKCLAKAQSKQATVNWTKQEYQSITGSEVSGINTKKQ